MSYYCPRCGREFPTDRELVAHIASEHPEYYAHIDDIDREIRRSHGKIGRMRSIIGRFGSARSRVTHAYFNAFPAIIGVIASFIIFSMIFPNPYLLAAGALLSLSMLFPREDIYGFIKALFIFLSVIIAFFGAQFIHKFLALVILFIGYASLSFRPLSEEAYYFEGALAVFRMVIGAFIAASPWFVFALPWNDPVAWGLGLIGAGFFILSFPEHEIPASISGRGIVIINEIGSKHAPVFSVLSLILVGIGVVIALNATITDIGFGFRAILFLILGLTSAFIAYSTPGHYRGEVGFPLYLLLLFTITTAYPDMLGEAVFGPWWVQISAGMESISKPLQTSFSQLHEGISDMWLMLTCPTCYYEKQKEKMEMQSQPQGSVLSLELVNFKSFSQYLDPAQKFEAIVTLQNQGEGEIKDLEIQVLNPLIKIKTGRKYEWKEIEVDKEITSCIGSSSGNKCTKDTVYTNEYVQFTFTLSDFGKIKGTEDTLDKCKCSIPGLGSFDCSDCEKCEISTTTPIQNIQRFIDQGFQCNPITQGLLEGEEAREAYCEGVCDTSKEGVYLAYKYGNYPVKLRFNYSFLYEATVSLQVMAMKKDLFKKMLKEGKLVQKEVISKYSGGPVLLSIWTPMEPIVMENGDKEITVSFKILNQGTGKVLKERDGEYTALIFEIPRGTDAEIDASKGTVNANVDCEIRSQKLIVCYLSKTLNAREDAGFSFIVKVNNFEGDTKTLTFTGKVLYFYGDEKEKQVSVISAPIS